MKRTIVALILLGAILSSSALMHKDRSNRHGGEFYTESGQNVSVKLALADTRAERKKGLMNTFWLQEDEGMIFVFPREDMRGFWMKNTYIPLDIIFLDEEFRIINIEQAKPQPFTQEEELVTYKSSSPAKYVIELNKGFTGANNISKGDLFVPNEKLRSCCV